jgi:hypothetical protein
MGKPSDDPAAEPCTPTDEDEFPCPVTHMCSPPGSTDPCPIGGADCVCRQLHPARWKYVFVHEAGHQIQDRAMGKFNSGSYTYDCPAGTDCPGRRSQDPEYRDELIDPPWATELCGCQHVGVANAEHCLQSVETCGKGQLEGFAQFYASKAWNRQTDDDCTFVYYKEFLDETCRSQECVDFPTPGGALFQSSLPPIPMSCADTFKWRNNHCPISEAAEMGIELDWMGFFWNLHTQGESRSMMSDIWAIYRHACNTPRPGGDKLPNPGPCVPRGVLSSSSMRWNPRPPFAPGDAAPCDSDSDCQESVQRCLVPRPGEEPVCLKSCYTDDDCGWMNCLTPEPRSNVPCDGEDGCVCKWVGDPGFREGAGLHYGLDSPQYQSVLDLGQEFGVTDDLSP